MDRRGTLGESGIMGTINDGPDPDDLRAHFEGYYDLQEYVVKLEQQLADAQKKNKRLEELVEFGEANIKIQFEACMDAEAKLVEARKVAHIAIDGLKDWVKSEKIGTRFYEKDIAELEALRERIKEK